MQTRRPQMPRLPTRMHSKHGNDYRCAMCGAIRGVITRGGWDKYFRSEAKCVNCVQGHDPTPSGYPAHYRNTIAEEV